MGHEATVGAVEVIADAGPGVVAAVVAPVEASAQRVVDRVDVAEHDMSANFVAAGEQLIDHARAALHEELVFVVAAVHGERVGMVEDIKGLLAQSAQVTTRVETTGRNVVLEVAVVLTALIALASLALHWRSPCSHTPRPPPIS
jgi:hypothetical protein